MSLRLTLRTYSKNITYIIGKLCKDHEGNKQRRYEDGNKLHFFRFKSFLKNYELPALAQE